MGGFTSNVDMRTGSPAFGTPEYVHAALATAQIGRRLEVPVRTSAVNASPAVDAQSTYETAFSLQAAILSHSHLINHAAGWLEGGLVASLEKIVVDAEMLRGWAEILKPVDFGDDDLAVDAIKGVAAGRAFLRHGAHAGPLRDRVLPSAAVGLVELRELDRGGRTRRDTTCHRHLEAAAGGVRHRHRSTRPCAKPSTTTSRVGRANSAARRLDGTAVAARTAGMNTPIMNARMYAVTPAVEAAWQGLLEHITTTAGVPMHYVSYPAPQPLETLWARPDLGCVFMCGYPIALGLATVMPLAAPVPRAAWAAGKARSTAQT